MKQVLILFFSMSFGVIPKTYQIENSDELEFSDGLLSNTVIDIGSHFGFFSLLMLLILRVDFEKKILKEILIVCKTM